MPVTLLSLTARKGHRLRTSILGCNPSQTSQHPPQTPPWPTSSSHDALANALEAYATLADEVRELLASFEIFDVTTIDRARALAKALRDAPSKATLGAEAVAALELRNRLCQLLQQHIRYVRDAAAFVFQDHPEIRREATSSHLRRQRASARSRAATKADTATTSTPSEQ